MEIKLKAIKFLMLMMVFLSTADAGTDPVVEAPDLTKRELIKDFAELGHDWAIKKEEGFYRQRTNGYASNPQEFKDLLESLVSNGNEMALRLKAYGLVDGKYGYEGAQAERLSAARDLLDFYAGLGNEAALRLKLEGIRSGKYGYEGTLAEALAAKDLIESLVRNGNEIAIGLHIEGLVCGVFGFDQVNNARARVLLDCQANLGNKKALELKLSGVKYGKYGYKGTAAEALATRNSIEEHATLGNKEALRLKVIGLENGTYGYEQNYATAKKVFEEMLSNGNEYAIQQKCCLLVEGGSLFGELHNQDLEEATEMLRYLQRLYILK